MSGTDAKFSLKNSLGPWKNNFLIAYMYPKWQEIKKVHRAIASFDMENEDEVNIYNSSNDGTVRSWSNWKSCLDESWTCVVNCKFQSTSSTDGLLLSSSDKHLMQISIIILSDSSEQSFCKVWSTMLLRATPSANKLTCTCNKTKW